MNKLNTLALSISLLAGTTSAYALTPWTNGNPDIIVYTSGGAAQDKAYAATVSSTLAAAGTLDTFSDVAPDNTVGGRWSAYYFTGNSNLPTGLAGKKILLQKRIYGAAGYGVVPLLAGIKLEQLVVKGTLKTAWTNPSANLYTIPVNATTASKTLALVGSDGGFLGVDPYTLLQPGTDNYPAQVPQITNGLPEAGWVTNLKGTVIPTTFTVVPTGGLVYGVGVTLDLYKVLQAAEKRAGRLPSTVTIGSYSESSLPSLNRNVIASLLAGKIGAWEQIKIVDQTDGSVKSLLDPAILADAGVTAPTAESLTGKNLHPVAVARRNNGAAVGAVAYATFLNYPSTASAFGPAQPTANDAVSEGAALPIVKSPGGAADSGLTLKDWQNGTNVLGFNNVSGATRWGIGINSADRNNGVTAAGTGGDPWRYIKVDGYAPTLENVAAGVYPFWAEGSVLFTTTRATDAQWALKAALLTAFAKDLGSPTVAATVNTTQAWGKTGIFATTKDPRGYTTTIPFSNSNPVVALTHNSDGTTHTAIVPVVNPVANAGVSIQLK